MVMKILLSDAGKRYNREWIFRHLNYEFNTGAAYAITGNNGSGKSTLLQVIAGAVQNNEGKIDFMLDGKNIEPELHHQYLSFAAPYLELPEELTLTEALAFHQSFKTFLPSVTVPSIINELGLQQAAHKQIRYYSSGMKQRVKLAQAVFSNVPVILLDEPCSNFDAEGIILYHHLIKQYCSTKLVIVSSNDEDEYRFCDFVLPLSKFK
jgi:ABC-type multidrug transport system ATPase subunit